MLLLCAFIDNLNLRGQISFFFQVKKPRSLDHIWPAEGSQHFFCVLGLHFYKYLNMISWPCSVFKTLRWMNTCALERDFFNKHERWIIYNSWSIDYLCKMKLKQSKLCNMYLMDDFNAENEKAAVLVEYICTWFKWKENLTNEIILDVWIKQ